jgi:AraC family transcriptional regulator of adaptative response/methylated-DNA-[protein]-cysteine methyltransferase
MNKVLPSLAEMHRAFRQSDQSYDGVFFAAVKTTHIFCRPSCPARKPLPANVEFLSSARDALFAGYRTLKAPHGPGFAATDAEAEASTPN